MPLLYYVSVTTHVLAALLWLGGTFFLAVVGAPVLRRVEPPELRAELFQKIGVQFRLVGWVPVTEILDDSPLNPPIVQLDEAAVIGEARRFGITTPIRPYPSIHIGAADVRPIEIVAAYSAFATL